MTKSIPVSEVDLIILACEAGMGSSLMSVNYLKKLLKKAKVTSVNVVHKPAREVSENAKVVVVHEGLAKVVQGKAPNAVVVPFKHFLKDPAFDKIVQAFVDGTEIVGMGE